MRAATDPACSDQVLPFEARFLEALQVRGTSQASEFQLAVSNIFDEIDRNGDGSIDRCELEEMMRTRIYPCCPAEVWALTPDELLEKLGTTGERVTHDEFVAAVERMADTLDRRVWPLATSQFFSALMFALNQPLMPLLVKDLGISMVSFGGFVALMPLVRVLLAFPSTYLANRIGRKPLTVEGQLVAAVGFGLSAFVASPLQLLAGRLIIGVGTSFAGVGQQSMLADIATGRTRSRIFAPGAARAAAAFAVGPALGGLLASQCGVQAAYVVIGAGMAAVSFRNRYILTETLRLPKKVSFGCADDAGKATSALQRDSGELRGWLDTARVFRKDPQLRASSLANVGYNITSISAKFVLLPMLALDVWGLGAVQLGAMLGAMSLVQLGMAKPAAHVADVYGRQWAYIPGLVLSAISMGLTASGAPTEVMVPCVCAGWAMGSALVGSVPSAMALDAAARWRLDQQETARVLAMSRVFGDVGMIGGSLASGMLLSSFGAEGALSAQASVAAVCALAAAVALRKPVI